MSKISTTVLLIFVLAALSACTTEQRRAERERAEESVAAIKDGDAIEVVDEDDGEKQVMVCKYERTTGTHTVKKVCQTRAQRDAQAKKAQEQMRSLNRKGGFCATPNCSN